MKVSLWNVARSAIAVVAFLALIRFAQLQRVSRDCQSYCRSAIKPQYIVAVKAVNLRQPTGAPTHFEVIVRATIDKLPMVFSKSISEIPNWAVDFNVERNATTTFLIQNGSDLCHVYACRGTLSWNNGKLIRENSKSLVSLLIPLEDTRKR